MTFIPTNQSTIFYSIRNFEHTHTARYDRYHKIMGNMIKCRTDGYAVFNRLTGLTLEEALREYYPELYI